MTAWLPANWQLYAGIALGVLCLLWLYSSLRTTFQVVLLLFVFHYYIFYWFLPEVLPYFNVIYKPASVWDQPYALFQRVMNFTSAKLEL